MNNLKLTATAKTIKGMPYMVYHITSTLEFLLIDLQKFLTSERKVKECLYCGKLFYPVHRTTVDYCPLPYKETGKFCYYIKRHKGKDELEALYSYAKSQQAKKHDYLGKVDKYGLEFMGRCFWQIYKIFAYISVCLVFKGTCWKGFWRVSDRLLRKLGMS